jgi:NADP-dependent 3-hydroxy acid dehydrogenase YdfG
LPQHCLFPTAGLRPFVNIISTAGLKIVPLQSVYAGTKNAVRTISEGLRQEAGDRVRHFVGLRPNWACRIP